MTVEQRLGSDMENHTFNERRNEQRNEQLDERRIDAAVALARRWVDEAAALDAQASRRARRRRRRLHTIVREPEAAEFTVHLTDEIPRIADRALAGRRFARLVAAADLSGFGAADRLALRLGAALAPLLPHLVMPLVERRLRDEASDVVLPADDPGLGRHLAMRRDEGMRPNVNVLGEAIVGDGEAAQRLDMVIERLRRPDVDYVSVKISAIYAGISTLAFSDTVERVVERLLVVYREAAACDPPVFVNLDMEEYRDLELTVAAFRQALDDPDIAGLDAGIVLQAYLPDVRRVAHELGDWATQRFVRGGGRTRVRLVKGANLAMETVEAELRGWELATYADKPSVDANYKVVLDVLTDPTFDDAIDIGVGSHNLFDVAWALGLRAEMVAEGRRSRIGIEMLEGMAPSQSKVVSEDAGGLLLYAPVVEHGDFPAALAYLVRRLDENTTPQNFLAQLFDLANDPVRFAREAERFASAVRGRHAVDDRPRRRQDRSEPPAPTPIGTAFANAADTDWTRFANRAWIAGHLQVGGVDANETAPGEQPIGRVEVDRAVEVARTAQHAWWAVGPEERADILHRVGDVLERRRGAILATMAHEAGKTVGEGDPEVSEAVDFARYYAAEARRLSTVDGADGQPLGTVVVAPPWNFPLAIPAGGVLAALAAGSTAILKPAPQSVRTAALVAAACWEAGVPHEALQFLPAPDGDVGRRLVTHRDVDAVVLTGAYATAAMFHDWRPSLRLHAETSGKNAIVVTATADIDLAVADIVRSAFGHAGQKCSAASLAIVDRLLYDDPAFLERLRDAAATLRVGYAIDLATDVGPLIEVPGASLERALTTLDAGETWLLEPECRSADRRSWTPGIRIGLQPQNWFARTECFGPVLGVVRADGLDDAIRIQNASDYGLTAGLYALDPDEISHWLDQVEAGNLYVNRGITGAIVQRQPFGGWKRSAVGPTAKAGGPNYVSSLMRWSDRADVDLALVEKRYEQWMTDVGRAEQDATGLQAERNLFRYRPASGIAFRFGPVATDRQRRLAEAAAQATGVRLITSEEVDEDDSSFVARLADLAIERVRLVGLTDGDELRRACHALLVSVDDAPPVGAAEIELPRWLREQAISITAHRHGRMPPGRSGSESVTPGTSLWLPGSVEGHVNEHEPPPVHPPAMDDVTELMVQSGDVSIATQSFGRIDNPGLMLIMGATASMLWWPEQLCRRLADNGFRVVRYDHRDTGRSTSFAPGTADYSVEDMVSDLQAVRTAYGFERVHLVGMSLGGLIAQIAAVTSPWSTATLTLIGSEPLGGSDTDLPGIDERFMEHFATMGDLDWSDNGSVADFLLEIARLSSGTPETFDAQPAIERIAAELERTDTMQSAFNHAAVELEHDWTGRLADVAAPTLVIHGELDPILPLANGQAISEHIANARLLVLRGVGHELPSDTLDDIGDAITDLARH